MSSLFPVQDRSVVDKITQQLVALPLDKNGALVITPQPFDSDIVTAFFANVLQVPSLTIAAPVTRTKTNPTGIVVQGNAGFLGYDGLVFTLTVAWDDDEKQAVLSIDGSFAADKVVTPPVITWISLGQLGLTAIYQSQLQMVQFAFHGVIISGAGADAAHIPFRLAPATGDSWQIGFGGGDSVPVSAEQLIGLVSGNALTSFFPPELSNILSAIAVSGLDATFDPKSSTVDYFSVGIAVTNGWDIAPKVSLEPGLQLTLTLVNPTDATNRQSIGTVTGTFKLNTTELPLFVQGTSGGGSSLWSFGVQPGQSVTLPSFSDLLGLAGGDDFLNALPSAFSQIPQILINDLMITFDPGKKTLNEVMFSIQTKSSWPVVAGYFEVTNIYVKFDIANVNVSASRTVAGLVRSTFDIDGVYLQCQIQKQASDPGWVLTAGLPPDKTVDLVQVAVKLFDGKITLPATKPPSMAFSELGVTIHTDTGLFTFSAHSADTWNFIDVKDFAIESFQLDFTRDPTKPQAPISGTLATTLVIKEVEVDFTASLNNTPSGGWFFEGKSDKIPLGGLIDYIAGQFSIHDLPQSITGITLDNLDITFNTTTKDFTFAVTGNIPVADKVVSVTVNISVLSQPDNSFKKDVKGTLTFAGNVFTLEFSADPTDKRFTATWNETDGGSLGLSNIAEALNLPVPEIPDGLDLGLNHASFVFDSSSKGNAFVLTAGSKNYGDGKASFIAFKPGANWEMFFGLATGKKIDLTDLPLIGSALSQLATVALDDIAAELASAAFSADDAKTIAGIVEKDYPQPPADGMAKGVDLAVDFDVGGTKVPIRIGTSASSNSQVASQAVGVGTAVAAANGGGTPPQTASDGTHWFTLQKTFGPVSIQKVGVRYADSMLWALMNASLSIGGLTISLIGLGVGSPLKTFSPHFTVSGVDVTFAEGPVVASGGLVGTIDPVDFYGEMLLEVPEFSLGALGGFAMEGGQPSFFLYLTLDMPLGGPPFFFVTGLAAGLGFNRALVIPPVSGVATFPLVEWATGGGPSSIAGGDVGTQVTNALTTLAQSGILAPKIGEYWLAAGVRFTSFELVDSFALVAVSFGSDFEVDVLGLSKVSLPPPPDNPDPVVYIELELEASFKPSQGLLAISGQLTPNSYLLSKDAHLTGGFAFYVWFAGDHEGQFLVTIGGYSPNFTPPNYYPSVPRLGLRWQLSGGALTVTGQEYFAVTSSAVMAGGGLSAVWNGGPVSAWFSVQVDFLMVYQPFHYYLSASCQLGASFSIDLLFTSITITIHLGVGIEIWGPEFTGRVDVDLSIISFTISFGASGQQNSTTIEWPDFVKKLMPKQSDPAKQSLRSARLAGRRNRRLAAAPAAPAADTPPPAIIQITVSKGLLKTLTNDNVTPTDTIINYVVDGELAELTVSSVIPIKASDAADPTKDFSSNIVLAAEQPKDSSGNTITPNRNFGVGPTGTDSDSFLPVLTIAVDTEEPVQFDAVWMFKNVPTALWQTRSFDANTGVPQNVDPLNGTTIPNTPIGWRLVPTIVPPDRTPLPIPLEYLKYTIDPNVEHFAFTAPTRPTTDSFTDETVPSTINTPGGLAVKNRPVLLGAINLAGIIVPTVVDVGDLAHAATDYLTAAPVLSLLGESK
jgi:hypothetical protein